MATDYPVLVTTRYIVPGAYIGQLISPAPGITPDTRIPAYIGVGSRFAVAKNQSVRRSMVFDHELMFPGVPPYRAQLPNPAQNDRSIARIVKSDGTEVALWSFIKNTETDKYDQVQISSEVFDPTTVYKISYQSIDRAVLDAIPVSDVREFLNVGLYPDANDFVEYQNYFANFTVTNPTADLLNTNLLPSLEAPVLVSVVGTGRITQNAASEFAHDYNRYYTIRCKTAGGATPTRVATFEWSAQPVSSGNANLPAVPLDPTIQKPTFSIAEATPASLLGVELELGIKIDLDFDFNVVDTGNFSAGDVFGFNGQGLALIEVDGRLQNTNQFHQQGAIVKDSGAGYAALEYANTSNPTNIYNANYKVECVAASDTSTKATVQVLRETNGLLFTAKVGGVEANSFTVGMVNPGIQNNPLSVTFQNSALVVSLATDNNGALSSTLTAVAAAVNALTASPVTATVVGVGSTLADPTTTSTADISNGSTSVTAGVGTAFTSELKLGSQVRFSSDPNNVYTVSAALAATSFTIAPAYTGLTVGATALAGTASVTNGLYGVTTSSAAFVSALVIGSRVKFASEATKVYIVDAITGPTSFELTTVYTGVTNAATTGTIPGTNIIEVSTQVGDTVPGVDGVLGGTLAWAEYGERIGISGTYPFSFTQATPTDLIMSMSSGVKLLLGLDSGPFAVGDKFTLTVKAPRQFYQQKDNRSIVLTTESITNIGAGEGASGIGYTTNTPEGGFGSVTAQDNAHSPAATTWQHGSFVLAGNVLMAARNLHGGPVSTNVGNRHVIGNKFSFSATVDGTLDWSLVQKTTETIAKKAILTDVLGLVTGTTASPYLILGNVPDTILSVTEAETGAAVSYALVTTNTGNNTQYIVFVTKPLVDIKVEYIYRGAEPAPGQLYYVSSKHIRPDDLYNQPILIRTLDDGRRLLAPSEATNHLHIMNEIAMGDIKAPAIYVIQVKDADGDGTYTDVDFSEAIVASEAPRAISDVVVLSHFSTLSQQLNSVNSMADPFKRRFRMTWIGTPTGTVIGDQDTPNSLIALSQSTLQVYGANPAHGTRVLVAATSCTRDIVLENKVVTEVTLDGSFVAGALAALNASFADPAETLLRKQLPGLKTIQTYGDVESPYNLALGGANIIFFTDQGGGIFRIEEDITVDTFAPDFNLINNMNQKMYVTKQVRTQLDLKLIGLIVPSEEAGVALIRSFTVGVLSALLGRGLIGRYSTPDGAERAINPTKDVIVFRDQSDPTLYHILYAYWLRNELKRITGLYSVNSNDFGA